MQHSNNVKITDWGRIRSRTTDLVLGTLFRAFRVKMRVCDGLYVIVYVASVVSQSDSWNGRSFKVVTATAFWVVPWHRRLAVGTSPRRPRFDRGPVHMGFVVGRVALGQIFLRVRRNFSVRNILPVSHTFIYLSPTLFSHVAAPLTDTNETLRSLSLLLSCILHVSELISSLSFVAFGSVTKQTVKTKIFGVRLLQHSEMISRCLVMQSLYQRIDSTDKLNYSICPHARIVVATGKCDWNISTIQMLWFLLSKSKCSDVLVII
jgi:hypothetical protein